MERESPSLNQSLLSQRDTITDDDDPSAELRNTRRGKATRTFREDQGMVTTLLAKHNKQSAPVSAYMSRVGSSIITIILSIIFIISAVVGLVSFARSFDAEDVNVKLYSNKEFLVRPQVYLCFHKTPELVNVTMKQKCIHSQEGKDNQCNLQTKNVEYNMLPLDVENKNISRLILGADSEKDVVCKQFPNNYTRGGTSYNILGNTSQYVEFNILQEIKYSIFNESDLDQMKNINEDAPPEFFSPSQIMMVIDPLVKETVVGRWKSSGDAPVYFLSSMAKVDLILQSVSRMYEPIRLISWLPISFAMRLIEDFIAIDKTEHQLGAFGFKPICAIEEDRCYSRTIIRLFLSKNAQLRDERITGKNPLSIIYYFGGTLIMFYIAYRCIDWILQHSICFSCYRSLKTYISSERRKQLAEDVVSATELA